MNQAGRDALRAAGLAGVPQLQGQLRDKAGGRCAFGVLEDACGQATQGLIGFYGMGIAPIHRCPLCKSEKPHLRREGNLMLHLNDRHRCDFLKIADLMPVTDAP
jgi:hypothetical protein